MLPPDADPAATRDVPDTTFPMHIVIAGAVGGIILVGVSVSLCVMCHLRRRDNRKRKREATLGKHPGNQRNALDMAVNNSTTTTLSLSQHDRSRKLL